MSKILVLLGFKKIRQKGSHVFYRHDDGRTTTVPYHRGRSLSRILIRKILSDINLSIADYNKNFKKI